MLLKHKENFIVPLIYKNTYEDLCRQMKRKECFRQIKELKETELHAFINRRFWQEENGHCEIFSVDANKGRDLLVSLYDTEQKQPFCISDIRLYIFKSGILFFVFSADYGKNISLYEAKQRNAALKDLYLHAHRFLIFDKELRLTEPLEENVFSDTYGCLIKEGVPDENGIQRVGLSVEKNVAEAEVRLFKNSKTGAYIDFEDGFFVKKKANVINCYRQEEFSLAYILERIISRLDIRFSDYFASSDNTIFPKKAVVFNMHVLDNVNEADVDGQLFHLAHGYSDNYKCLEEGRRLSTFANSFWKITREGAANINLVDREDKDGFLLQYFDAKFDTVYLWILLLVLHQYYGLQYFTCKLLRVYQESTRIEKNSRKKKYEKLVAQMEEIKQNGDLFLLQYVFVDISQISHQNEIYAYMCETYNIQGLIDDYRTNADICNKILEQKQQNALQKKVNIIAWASGFFAIFTAVMDTLATLLDISSASAYLFWGLLGTAGLVLVAAGIIYFIKQMRSGGKTKDDGWNEQI